MGLPSKIIHGARAKVSINGQVVGIWTTFSFSFALDVVPAYLLGAFGPRALTTVGYEPVSITAGGWRVLDNSFFKVGGIPDLSTLLQQTDLLLTVIDRTSNQVIAEIQGCLPTGVSVNLSSKQLSDGSNSYLGMLVSTEDFDGNEGNAVQLPQ